MHHQHHVQQMGFLLGVLLVGADHPQKVFRRGQIVHREVDVQGIPLKIVPLHRVGVGHDRGEAAHQLDGLQQHILHGGIVRVVVIGIQRQHTAGQLVHDVPAGVPHDHILGKAVRQLPGAVHDLVEAGQLRLGGQIAEQQQICHLLIAEGAGLAVSLHDLVQLDTAVVQLAGLGNALAVLNEIALHAAHLGHACQNAGTDVVAQTALYVAPVIFFADMILAPDQLAQRTCEFFQSPAAVVHADDLLSVGRLMALASNTSPLYSQDLEFASIIFIKFIFA